VCSSARGLLSQFNHKSPEIKAFALKKLITVVDSTWHEIAYILDEIQTLALDSDYPFHQDAAYLASLVHYHLENYKESLTLALESGPNFDIYHQSDYVRTLVSHCINQYISAQVQNFNARNAEDRVEISERMTYVVEQMFERCFADQEFKQAIGISIEARRLDKLEDSIIRSQDPGLLKYTYEIVKDIVLPKEFKRAIVVSLVKLHMSQPVLDFVSVSEYKFFIDDSEALAILMLELIKSDSLLAYQLSLDLVDNQRQAFLNQVIVKLSQTPENSPAKTNVLKILNGLTSIELTLNFLQTKSNTINSSLIKLKTLWTQRRQ